MTYKDLLKLPLQERNEVFNDLTRNEQRVMIAQDVIAQVEIKKFIANRGDYLILNIDGTDVSFMVDAIEKPQETLEEPTVKCQVCAIGAVYMSRIHLGNNVDMFHIGSHRMIYQLDHRDDIFTEKELRMMETAFEGASMDWSVVDDDDYDGLVEFTKGLTDEDALVKIMNNIIENNGELKLVEESE